MTEQPPQPPKDEPPSSEPPRTDEPAASTAASAPPPQPPPRPPMPPPARPSGRSWQWGCGLGLAGCLIAVMLGIFFVLAAIMGTLGGVEEIEPGKERLALIRIEGIIVAGESGFSMFGGGATGSDDVVDQIERAIRDEGCKGILLRINSPGGSAAGSQEIYHAINRAREEGKIVVASMADVAASGGYYVAAPCDMIFADPATITGSIGAIAIHQNMAGLFDKIGIESEIIKSGPLKDMFQPTRPLSDDAREVITTLIAEVHSQFVEDVAAGRDMENADVRVLADGRIYSGQQAVENGLVDELGGMHEAVMEAGRMAGMKGRPPLKEYGPPNFLRWLLGSEAMQQRAVAVTGGLLYDDFAARLALGSLYRAIPQTPNKRTGEP